MQVAWMQGMHAAMEANIGWLPEDTGEVDDDNAEQDGFYEIDVEGELLRVATEGLIVVANATAAAASLRLQLASVKKTFELVQRIHPFPQHPGGDDLELCAAKALQAVDELLRQQAAHEALPLPPEAVEELKLLQKHAQDCAVLACSRFLSQAILQRRGIAPELLSRFEAAFTPAALQDDGLWSRLGNSKYHVFAVGNRFGERKRQHGRGGRNSWWRKQRDTAEDEAPNIAPGGAAGLGDPLFVVTKDMMVAASSCPADVGTGFLETLD